MSSKYLVHIVAVDENNGIGFEGNLLFPIKEDLKHFKRLTMGHDCIAGSKTLDGLPPLRNRTLIRMTRDPMKYLSSADHVICKGEDWLKQKGKGKRAFIIGGGEVYKETLKDVSVIMLTRIHAKAEKCDTYYPDFLSERKPLYCAESTRHIDEATGLEYSFHIYGYDKKHLVDFISYKQKVEQYERQAPK